MRGSWARGLLGLVRAPMRDIQLQIHFPIPHALSLTFAHCNSSLPPLLKLGFELFISVYVLFAHHFSFASYQLRNLTNHIISLEPGLTDPLG